MAHHFHVRPRIGALAACLFAFASLLFVLATPSVSQASGDQVVASAARLAGDEQRTRLVVDLDRSVAFRIFALADPYRVIVDLPETSFELPEEQLRGTRGLVSDYRLGRIGPGKSRIVLDVSAPVTIDKSFVLEPLDGQPARLVIDLVPTDRRSFLSEIASIEPEIKEQSTPTRVPAAPVVAVPPGGERGRTPVIVIDPGHGGIDPGAVGKNGTREKDIVLTVGKRLAAALAATGRYQIKMTREDDTFIRLDDRVSFGRENEASLFISIHADAINYASIGGATVYTRSEQASDRGAALLAEKENRADLIAGVDLSEEPDDVAGILFDLVRRETRNFSVLFARTAVQEMRGSVQLNKNPVRSARFHVLSAPDIPAVLVELGYLTNPRDEAVMHTEDWQKKMVGSLMTAIETYFGKTLAQSANQ